MMQYVGTKLINAEPMTRQAYNDFRGWTLPPDEDGSDTGYLIESLDSAVPNVPTHKGYVSWVPSAQFEATHCALPTVTSTLAPHEQRVIAEKVQLDVKIAALSTFVQNTERFNKLSGTSQSLLVKQMRAMSDYRYFLAQRIDIFTGPFTPSSVALKRV